jgi:hypothetical protein
VKIPLQCEHPPPSRCSPFRRWADLSEPGYGVALLNDCKYGHATHGATQRLTLLRWAGAVCWGAAASCGVGEHPNRGPYTAQHTAQGRDALAIRTLAADLSSAVRETAPPTRGSRIAAPGCARPPRRPHPLSPFTRSPKGPDATTDMGGHALRYGLLPHAGSWAAGGVVAAAAAFNSPLRLLSFPPPSPAVGLEPGSHHVASYNPTQPLFVVRLVQTYEQRFCHDTNALPRFPSSTTPRLPTHPRSTSTLIIAVPRPPFHALTTCFRVLGFLTPFHALTTRRPLRSRAAQTPCHSRGALSHTGRPRVAPPPPPRLAAHGQTRCCPPPPSPRRRSFWTPSRPPSRRWRPCGRCAYVYVRVCALARVFSARACAQGTVRGLVGCVLQSGAQTGRHCVPMLVAPASPPCLTRLSAHARATERRPCNSTRRASRPQEIRARLAAAGVAARGSSTSGPCAGEPPQSSKRGLIVRLYEPHGGRGLARIAWPSWLPVTSVTLVDLLEREVVPDAAAGSGGSCDGEVGAARGPAGCREAGAFGGPH